MLNFYIKSIYNQIPNVYKRLGNEYRKFFFFLNESDNWDGGRILEYREKKYKEIKELYRNKIVCNDTSLKEFVSKKELQANPSIYLLDKKNKYFECMTGGSTGIPTKFYLSKEGVRRNEAFLDFILNKEGISRFLIPRKVIFRGDNLPNGKDHLRVFNTLYLSSFSLSEEKLIKYINIISEFKPSLIHAFPSSINSLVNTAIVYNKKIEFESIKHILISSEICNIKQKEKIKIVFKNAKIIDFYSNSEQTVMGYQIDFNDGYFPFQYGNVITDESEIIYSTSFLDPNNILFNYKTEDVVSGFYIDCNNNFRYKGIEGRMQDYLYGYDADKVSIAALNMHENFFDGVISFQFEQFEKGKVIINIVINESGISNKKIIENYFINKLKSFDIKFKYPYKTNRTKSGKELLIISKIKES